MSTRWYPLFQPGNPQLRVFLPNFWMKLVRGKTEDDPRPLPNNRVRFIVSMEMTRHDVKNYLKKIYNVDVVEVHTRVMMGDTKAVGPSKTVIKDDDYKLAFVTLPEGSTFEYPDIYAKEKVEAQHASDTKATEQLQITKNKLGEKLKGKPGLPPWFL